MPRDPMSRESDDDLALRARGGSASAMEELYARYRLPLFRYAWRLTGDASLAEDVLQAVFTYFFRNLERYEPRGRLSAYLHRIARSVALDEKAAGRREREEAARRPLPDPDEAGRRQEGEDLLRTALTELSPALREIVELRVYQDLDYAEIAEVAGISEATARSRLRYALEALRTALKARREDVP
jgi:RNA polymerase sigma-70 factor (ECF subfamily)